MSRPATLVRSVSETSVNQHKRPVHMLLRAPSACHAANVHAAEITSHVEQQQPARTSSISSASSMESREDSLFDIDSLQGSPMDFKFPDDDGYFTDDTEFDDEPACLDLSDSGFTSVPVPLFAESECLLQVQTLDLSHNPMDGSCEEYLAENIHLPNLESLRLQSCQMSTLGPLLRHLRAPNLRELDISDHQLVGDVPPLQLYFPKLHTFRACRGRFNSVDESAVAGLTYVDLSDNNVNDDDGQLSQRCEVLGTKLVI